MAADQRQRGGAGGATGARVFVVHQDTALREMVAQALAEEGYGVVAASHQDALGLLRRAGEPRPAVVLLDLHGDARGCVGVFRRAVHSEVPIVGLTTAPMPEDGSAIGVATILPLPFELDALLDCVAHHCHPR